MSSPSKSSNSSLTQNAILQFCSQYQRGIEIKKSCDHQIQEYKAREQVLTQDLMEFMRKNAFQCIPVTVPKSDKTQETETRYLQYKMASRQRALNDDIFRSALGYEPTSKDIEETFTELSDEMKKQGDKKIITNADVFSYWLIKKLKEKMHTEKPTLKLTKGCMRMKDAKTKMKQLVTAYEPVRDKVIQYYKTTENHKELQKIKKQKLQRIKQDKMQFEPIINKYFQSKPQENQVQKVSMKIDGGESKPCLLERKVTVRSAPVPAKSSLRLIQESVIQSANEVDEQWTHQPFSFQELLRMVHSDQFRHRVYDSFYDKLQYLKDSNKTTTVKLVIRQDKTFKKRKNPDSSTSSSSSSNQETVEEEDEYDDVFSEKEDDDDLSDNE